VEGLDGLVADLVVAGEGKTGLRPGLGGLVVVDAEEAEDPWLLQTLTW
jgi:hypothetical protein